MWTVANRISPTSGGIVRAGLKVNTVRMLGGILKKEDGKKVPDYDYDPCQYDSATNSYVYNWEPLKARIDAQLNSNYSLFQIVIDQPPWAFQYGYTFIPEGTRDSVNFRENERISHYGNSLPPSDPVAYNAFIKAMMEELIATYGESLVSSWRFRVGSEIETPDHWFGTKQDFIEHFANTESAIREVLPDAIVGLHTREPKFLYKNGTVLNYKGDVIASFAQDLIEYCYDNNIQYDFWGISEYLLINDSTDRDISKKYDELIAPFVENPKWNHNATIDIMEYSVVITMKPPDGGISLTVGTSHSDAFNVVLADMFYSYDTLGLDQVFRWGQRPNTIDPPSVALLASMDGKIRYLNERSGSPAIAGNMVDAIFSKSATSSDIDLLAFNYNASSLSYREAENITIKIQTDLPAGTLVNYRSALYGKDQNKLQNFLENEPDSGWIKDGWDWKGSPPRTLNSAGEAAWNEYINPNPWDWTEWTPYVTLARSDGGEGSEIEISTTLGSFSFEKYEIRHDQNLVEELKPPKKLWTSEADFQEFITSQMNETISDSLLIMYITGSYPNVKYNSSYVADPFGKARVVVKNETTSDIFWLAWYVDGVKTQKRFLPTPSINDTSFHTYTADVSETASWQGTVDYFTLEVANRAGSGTVTLDTIEFLLGEGVVLHAVNVNSVGNGTVTPSSGTCYTGQQIKFTAIPFPGSQFDGWTGDSLSPENPLSISIETDMSLTAHFSLIPEKYTLSTSALNGTIERSPDMEEYEDGTTILLTAVPDTNFTFDSWSGDMEGNENPASVIMDSEKNITANFSLIQGLLSENTPADMQIFPNPTSGHINLSAKHGKPLFYKIFNSNGVEIQSGIIHSNKGINISDRGIYFVVLQSEDLLRSHRFVVH